ncbi:MAG: hypothetical protein WDN06_01625 [Asticcacaulis sp.]
MNHDPQKDLLKDLLNAAPAAHVPARDLAFNVDVMAKVERKRLMESVLWIVAGTLAACLLLAIVMPYVTPAVATLGKALLPAAIIISLVAAGLIGLDQTRRFLKLS